MVVKKREIIDINASIALHTEGLEELTKTINCFLSVSLKKELLIL